MRAARRVVRESLDVAPGETGLIIVEPSSPIEFVRCLQSVIEQIGAHADVLMVQMPSAQPHGYLTWDEPPAVLGQALHNQGFAVVYARTLICLSRTVTEARNMGTRLLFIPADFDLSRPVVLEEDLDELAQLGEAMVQRLLSARTAEIRCPAGTNLTLGPWSQTFFDDARCTGRGDIDFFPGGMWNVIPEPQQVNGRVVFTATLHPLGFLAQPIEVRFQRGVIHAIEGGWQARAWERWLESFHDPDVYSFSHLSGGLAAASRVTGHDWEDLIKRGSVLVSGGENALYGGRNTAKAHFDGIVLDATLLLDGREVLRDGAYQLDLRMHQTEGGYASQEPGWERPDRD